MTLSHVARSEWRHTLALLLGTRLALTLVGIVAMAVLPLGARHLGLLPSVPVLEMWAQWDAEHYVSIALDGYVWHDGGSSNVAFFPLYPLLIWLVTLAIGRTDPQSAALVGLVISNVALFVALIYLSALVTRDFTLSLARRTVLYVLVYPTTIFLSSAYAEPLFLATSVAAMYHARAGEWGRAGVAGFLSALARPFGILLAGPIVIELYRQRAPARAWPAAACPLLGIAVLVGYLWWLFGDPLAYFKAGETWHRGLFLPWEVALGYLQEPLQLFDWPFSLLDWTAMFLMALLALASWRVLPASYAAYATAGVLLAMSTGYAWYSASRHALALFPVLIVIALLGQRSRAFEVIWLALSIFLTIAFMAREAVGYWVA